MPFTSIMYASWATNETSWKARASSQWARHATSRTSAHCRSDPATSDRTAARALHVSLLPTTLPSSSLFSSSLYFRPSLFASDDVGFIVEIGRCLYCCGTAIAALPMYWCQMVIGYEHISFSFLSPFLFFFFPLFSFSSQLY